MPDTMILPCHWQDTSPDGYRHRALLIAECALGVTSNNPRLAIAELDAEMAFNEGLITELAGFGARQAVRLAQERQRREAQIAARRQRAAERNDALEAEKKAKRKAQAKRLQRLLDNRRKSTDTVMAVPVVPDYSGENVGGAS